MTPLPRVWFPALIGGVLTYLCFFPVNFGFLAWVAVVPWFALVAAERPRARGIYAACFGGSLFCHLGLLQWIRVAHPAMYGSWATLAFLSALGACATLFVARRLTRAGLPVWLAGAIAFVAVDYARSHFPTGFSWLEPLGLWRPIGFGWYLLGHTQHDFLPIIQIADLTGVYGITFVVVLVNGVLFTILSRTDIFRRYFRLADTTPAPSRLGTVVALSLVLACLAYGTWRLNHRSFEDGPDVALIQGNAAQDIRNAQGEEMMLHFEALCDEAVRGRPMPELIVWPETSFLGHLCDVAEGVDPAAAPIAFRRNVNHSRLVLRESAGRWPTNVLYGMNRFEWEPPGNVWLYNSAVLVDKAGQVHDVYDKVHLVPFGEYVPFVETLPFLKAFTPYDGDYSCKPGRRFTKFVVPTDSGAYSFGCLICYEDSDPALARRYVGGDRPVDFLVNISNDGWFDGTEEHEQHLAVARFRAVETRRSLLRSVNMGVSAIIDPAGRVVALPGETWAKSKKVTAIVRGRVPIGTQFSPYAVVGDWLPLACWASVLFMIVRRIVRGRRRSA